MPDESHGLIISPRGDTQSQSSSLAIAVLDLDFADDIVLLSHSHEDAQALLTSVEKEALTVGLKINCKKMEYMLVGDFKADPELTVIEGPIVQTKDFKYLGSWVLSSRRDFEVQRAQAWQACKWMHRVWRSNVTSNITSFSSHCRDCLVLWSRGMDTDQGVRESSEWYLHPATVVCPRD